MFHKTVVIKKTTNEMNRQWFQSYFSLIKSHHHRHRQEDLLLTILQCYF